MLRTPLGFSSFNIGRYSGQDASSPNYDMRFTRSKRILYHSGLDELITYPQIPNKTIQFSHDMLPIAEWTEQKTLSSNLTQQWDAVYEDVIVKEIYDSPISQTWAVMHKFYRFWTTILDTNEYSLWRPLDLTDKLYRVRVVNILIDGKEYNPTYVGVSIPEKWLTATLEVWLKLMPASAPTVTVFASGNLGSGSP